MSKAIYVGVDNKARKVKSLYVGVDGKARKVKKGYIGVNGVARLFYAPVDRPPRLPSGYDELEYIYSSDGAKIATGIYTDVETKIVAKLQITGTFSEDYYIIHALGSGSTSSGSGSNSLSLYLDSAGALFCRIGNVAGQFLQNVPKVQVAQNLAEPFEVTLCGDGSCKLNGLAYNTNSDVFNFYAGRPEISLIAGTKSSANDLIKVYYCQIYNNDTLVRDLVPCKNSAGMVGMYDLVSDSLFSTATANQFLAGPKIY